MRRYPVMFLWGGLTLLALLSLSGCGMVDQLGKPTSIPVKLQVEQTVAAQMEVINLQATAFALETQAAALQPTTIPPEPIIPPTYTPLPTYTSLPTYTFPPAATAGPVYIPPPPPAFEPTQETYYGHPYVLRVRNQNTKATLWIGTDLPYGGNFIKPLYYVEFYPPQPTWLRITWCRRSSYPHGWFDHWWDDWYSFWQRNDIYNCQSKDVRVNQPFKEIGVR